MTLFSQATANSYLITSNLPSLYTFCIIEGVTSLAEIVTILVLLTLNFLLLRLKRLLMLTALQFLNHGANIQLRGHYCYTTKRYTFIARMLLKRFKRTKLVFKTQWFWLQVALTVINNVSGALLNVVT